MKQAAALPEGIEFWDKDKFKDSNALMEFLQTHPQAGLAEGVNLDTCPRRLVHKVRRHALFQGVQIEQADVSVAPQQGPDDVVPPPGETTHWRSLCLEGEDGAEDLAAAREALFAYVPGLREACDGMLMASYPGWLLSLK